MPSWEMTFEGPKWYTCDWSLLVENAKSPSSEPPEQDWPARGSGIRAAKAQEEVLETILIRNLATLVDESLQFVFRGGDYWGIQDITAIDNLGRFHLFELKRDRIKKGVADQLGTYLLGNLFQSDREFLKRMWRLNRTRLTPERWALYLAAALVNERTSNLGKDVVNGFHPEIASGQRPPFTKWTWEKRLSELDRQVLRAEALCAKAQPKLPDLLTVASVFDWAKDAFQTLTSAAPTLPRVRPAGRVVIWLAGHGFDNEAFEKVRVWRRAGIDARCLDVDARQSRRTGKWTIAVSREDYPERTKLFRKFRKAQDQIEANDTAHELDLLIYERKAPSDIRHQDGGLPLGQAAKIEVKDKAGKTIKTIR